MKFTIVGLYIQRNLEQDKYGLSHIPSRFNAVSHVYI